MPRFRFRLSTLLRLRETVRDERRARLAEALQAQDIVGERQRELNLELTELTREQRQTVRPGAVNTDRLMQAQRHELILRSQQQELDRQQKLLLQECETRREALAAAERDVKALENLRARLAERHAQAEAVAEGKLLDELGMLRATRREVQAWAD